MYNAVPITLNITQIWEGAQWLSGRVLYWRPWGRRFEPHPRHCVVSWSKTHKSLLSTGSAQEDLYLHNRNIADGM